MSKALFERRLEFLHSDIVKWFQQFSEPMPLRVLTQRHARRFKGERVSDYIERDPRYLLITQKSGGRLVVPLAELEVFLAEAELERTHYLKGFDAKW